MRDRHLREWKARVRERASAEWRDLSADVVDELACNLADLHAAARERGASEAGAERIAADALQSASLLELSKRPRARRSPIGCLHDLRVAYRQLVATPAVTFVAVLSLALGLGANTAVFSLVNTLSLRALPVKDPQRLALLSLPSEQDSWTFPLWQELRRHPQLFESAFAWGNWRFNLASGGVAEFVDGAWTTAGM